MAEDWQDHHVLERGPGSRPGLLSSLSPTQPRRGPYDPSLSPAFRSLSGRWRFRLAPRPSAVPTGFAGADFPDEGWDEIPVPVALAVARVRPARSTPTWPTPSRLTPRGCPSENPTGCYRREVELGPGLAGAGVDVVLRFEGVDSAFHVFWNGEQIGYSQGSRLPSEFDVTRAARAGRNVLAVEVYQWSDGSYLEDQDMWWLSGIFRECLAAVAAAAPPGRRGRRSHPTTSLRARARSASPWRWRATSRGERPAVEVGLYDGDEVLSPASCVRGGSASPRARGQAATSARSGRAVVGRAAPGSTRRW